MSKQETKKQDVPLDHRENGAPKQDGPREIQITHRQAQLLLEAEAAAQAAEHEARRQRAQAQRLGEAITSGHGIEQCVLRTVLTDRDPPVLVVEFAG